jgi:hypothetical protein
MKRKMSKDNSNNRHDTAVSQSQQLLEEENIRIARRSIEALNTGDTSTVYEYVHPDYFNHES